MTHGPVPFLIPAQSQTKIPAVALTSYTAKSVQHVEALLCYMICYTSIPKNGRQAVSSLFNMTNYTININSISVIFVWASPNTVKSVLLIDPLVFPMSKLSYWSYWKPLESLGALGMLEQWVLNRAFGKGLFFSFMPPISLLPVGTIPHRRDICQKAFNT